MPGRRNYEKAVRELDAELTEATGAGALLYIERPGGGEPPRYVFESKTCLGGPEALAYMEGLVAALREVLRTAQGVSREPAQNA